MSIIKFCTTGKYIIDNQLYCFDFPTCIECDLPISVTYLDAPFWTGQINKDCNSECVKLVPFVNDYYHLYITNDNSTISAPLKEILYETVFDINISVFVSNNTFVYIYRHGCLVNNIVTKRANEAFLQKSKNHIVIMLTCDDFKWAIVLDKQYNLVYNDQFEKIEIHDDVVIILKNLNDSLHHGKVYKFYEETESYLVYIDNDAYCPHPAIAFMDCLAAQNYDRALQVVNSTLSASAAKLEGFFGEIDCYYYNDNTDGKLNFTIHTKNGYKNVSLDVKDGLITEIEEEDI